MVISAQFSRLFAGLNKQYLIRDVDVTFEAGAITAIMGTSGCGKTMFLRALLGAAPAVLSPDSSIRYGCSGSFVPPDEVCRRGKVAAMFPGAEMVPWRSIFRMFLLPGQLNPSLSPPREEHMRTILADLNLDSEILNHAPFELSFGMKQRVSLAIALIYRPLFLFLDEALIGLDPATSEIVVQHLKKYIREQNAVCILVTHKVDSAERFGDDLYMISRKRRVLEKLPSGIESSEIFRMFNDEIDREITYST